MRTKEFIKRAVGIEGVIRHVYEGECLCLETSGGRVLAQVSLDEPYGISTDYVYFYKLETQVKEELLTLLHEYAKTPLEEREEPPKKYRLQHKLGEKGYNSFLRYDGNTLDFGSRVASSTFRTTATINEWEHLTHMAWSELLLQFTAEEASTWVW